MVGKLARLLVGRSMAKKRGYSGAAGAVAALLAPYVLKRVGKLAAKGGSRFRNKRRARRGPDYGPRLG